MFFQSKSGPRLFEANRQFGQIVYGKSGRIGDLPYMHGAKFKFSGYMTVSGLCMHDALARALAEFVRASPPTGLILRAACGATRLSVMASC